MAELSDPITRREKEILQMVATGATNRQIAHELNISVNTVKVHVRNIFGKLGAESRTEASMIAVRQGWVSVGDDANTAETTEPSQSLPTGMLMSVPEPAPPLRWPKRVSLIGAVLVVVAGSIISWPRDNLQVAAGLDLPLDQPLEQSGPVSSAPESSWQEYAQMPTRRAHLALASTGRRLVAIGGQTPEGVTAAVEMYDPGSDTWSLGQDKPTPAAYISAVTIGTAVYVPGGCNDTGAPTQALEIYHSATNAWSEGSDLPEPRCAYALAAMDERLYLLGGWDGERYSASVFVYDPGQDIWTEGTPLETSLGFAAAAPLGNRLYLVGGYDGERELATCAAYDPSARMWEECAPLSLGRGGLGLVSVGNQLYAIGGGGWTSYLGFNERYDPVDDDWSLIETPLVGEWRSPGVVAFENTIYAVGGWSNDYLSLSQAYEALPFRVFIPTSPQ